MQLIIEPKIFSSFPDLKLGVVVIHSLDNTKRVSALESLLRGICAQRKKEFEGKDLHEVNNIKVWNDAYGKFGTNPKKYPPSIAALLKRIQAGKEIPHVSALVDLYNYFSLKYLMPIGGEDLDWLCGDLRLTFTEGGEAFRPLGDIDVKEAGEGEVAYMDSGGITCRYWNHRECERTKFSNRTVNAAVIMEDLTNMHMDKFGAILNELAQGVEKYIGGDITTHILSEDNSSMELGVEGRKTADDAKVTQQEKVHFMSKKKQSNQAKALKKEKKNGQATLPLNGDEEPQDSLKLEDSSLLKQKIKGILEVSVTSSFPNAVNGDVNIEYPSSQEHGDYASNVAMHLAKKLAMNPREVAEKIVEKIAADQVVEKAEVAGPGFINFFVKEEYLNKEVQKVLEEKDKYGSTEVGKSKNLIAEYSAPNIAKPLGVHHLLTTIIGQSLYNIYGKLGFNNISINHIGDWGTQFGKLICAYKKWGKKKEIEADPINEMLKLYVKFHDEAEGNPELEDEARKEFREFEQGDKENRKLWQWFVDESMKEIKKTYDKLGGIHFDYTQGESFYEDKMEPLLKDGKEKGIFVNGEEGSFIVEYDDPDLPPFVVQKKDGATLYSTRDFAALKYRIEEFKPVKILYVVDIAQSLHFKQLYKAAERFPWYHGEAVHVWFGRMHMEDGKMSTRKGTVILMDDLLDEAVLRAEKVVEAKNPDLSNKENVAKVVGVGAVKYNILSQNRTTDITFDWDKVLALDGNSAPYLQYSYARAKSILRKAATYGEGENKNSNENQDSTPGVVIRNLIRLFPKFAEQIALSAKEYKPNILCNYLYDLAQQFNSFYNNVPVLKAENEKVREERLKIVEAASQILKNGLELLGIEVVEEM